MPGSCRRVGVINFYVSLFSLEPSDDLPLIFELVGQWWCVVLSVNLNPHFGEAYISSGWLSRLPTPHTNTSHLPAPLPIILLLPLITPLSGLSSGWLSHYLFSRHRLPSIGDNFIIRTEQQQCRNDNQPRVRHRHHRRAVVDHRSTTVRCCCH